MKKATLLLLVAALLAASTAGFAASPWTEETTYGGKTTAKLAFGFKNTLLGWTEIFSVPETYAKEDKNVLVGIGKGLSNALCYTAGGAVHLVTFLIPVDVPLPNNGVQV